MRFKFKNNFHPPPQITLLFLGLLSPLPRPILSVNIINVNIESLSESLDPNVRRRFQQTPSPTDLLINDDIKKIRKDLPDFQRPDFKQIPYLIQRVNIGTGITEYLLPPEEPGQAIANVAFSRHSLDTHLSVLIFPTGYFQWQPPIDRKYVVLRRHSKKTPVYFLTYAYVRQTGLQRFIEWSVEELSLKPPKTKIEQELCRGEICDIPEWILGTCTILSNKCNITLDKVENETIFRQLKTEEIDDVDDEDQFLNFNGGSSSSESKSDELNSKNPFFLPISSESDRRRRKRSLVLIPTETAQHIPSSLDLLFLSPSNESRSKRTNHHLEGKQNGQRSKRSSKSSQKQHDHNMEEILHILKCRNCQKLGNFYGDLEEEVAFNRILGDKFAHQFNNSKPKHWRRFPWMKRSTGVAYVGYGECTYISIAPNSKKPISSEMDDVIEFYLDTLRLECNTVLKNEIRGWLTSKLRFLKIVQDLSFEIIPSSKLLKYSMLTPNEFEMLTSAILFLKYSSVYREDSASKSPGRVNLLGHPLSSKVSFLTKVFMKVVDCANRYLQHHMIKISRSLARILKDKFYALMLEKRFIHLKKLGKQAHLNKENYRDRIQIMALKEFLLYGLSPIFRSGTSTEVAFKSFYQLNENRIRFLVHSYGVDAPQSQ